jgi:hypothetical protein
MKEYKLKDLNDDCSTEQKDNIVNYIIKAKMKYFHDIKYVKRFNLDTQIDKITLSPISNYASMLFGKCVYYVDNFLILENSLYEFNNIDEKNIFIRKKKIESIL